MKYIIGVGNYSMFDDSIGIKIVEHISENNLEDGFVAVDLSGNALNIFSYLCESTKKILLIDTVKEGIPPGEYRFFTPDRVTSEKELSQITSHEGDMIKVLELARQTGYHIPEIVIMGIGPAQIKMEYGLSPILKEKFNEFVENALIEIIN